MSPAIRRSGDGRTWRKREHTIQLMESPVLINSPNLPPASDSQIKRNRIDFNSAVKFKNDGAILKSYSETEASGVCSLRDQLPVVLKACVRLQVVEFGREIHSAIVKSGLVVDTKVMTALIDFYCKCGFLDDARQVFDEMGERDLVSWNAILCGFVENLRNMDALSLFSKMRRSYGLSPNSVTLVCLLSACRDLKQLKRGREIHCYCLKNGFFDSEVHVATALVSFYSTLDLRYSRSVFDSMEVRNKVTWNAILYAYIHSGNFDEITTLFVDMILEDAGLDSVTFLAILKSCAKLGFLEFGKQVHQLAAKHGFLSDNFVANSLIVMYGECGEVGLSLVVLENMHSVDLASWNAVLASFRNWGCSSKAVGLFKQMHERNIRANSVTLATMLSICGQSGNLEMGKELHAYATKTRHDKDLGVESALLNMYVESASISCACTFFRTMQRPHIVSWNTLIKALFDHGYKYRAWELFEKMWHGGDKPNSYTMVSLLSGCDESLINVGKSIHGYILRRGIDMNPSLCTALSSMYMNCGFELAAMYLFWAHSERDAVSWNAMIASFFRIGQPWRALSFFRQMLLEMDPNSTTVIIALLSCARMANLPIGKCLHACTIRRKMDLGFGNISLGNALLTMYAKCGNLKYAALVFNNLKKRNVISWNAIIASYGMHGHGNDALEAFYQMLKVGEKPTGVTFVSILASCSHSGLVESGKALFLSMTEDYGITPEMAHYGCMVDLFGRAGFIEAALNVVRSMPIEPDASVWRTLLSACQSSCDLGLAKHIAEKLNEIEPLNSANYMLLSNIYAAAGRWESVRALKKQMKEWGLQKAPGTSWVAIRNQINSFSAGNSFLAQNSNFSEKLETLLDNLINLDYEQGRGHI